MKREKTHINQIRQEKDIKTDSSEIQNIIKECFENIYSKKLEKSKRNKFLNAYICQN